MAKQHLIVKKLSQKILCLKGTVYLWIAMRFVLPWGCTTKQWRNCDPTIHGILLLLPSFPLKPQLPQAQLLLHITLTLPFQFELDAQSHHVNVKNPMKINWLQYFRMEMTCTSILLFFFPFPLSYCFTDGMTKEVTSLWEPPLFHSSLYISLSLLLALPQALIDPLNAQ